MVKTKKPRINRINKDNLYDQLMSDENILLAIKKATKHLSRKHKKDPMVQHVKANPEKWISFFRHYVEHYKSLPRKPIEIYDGISRKKRYIVVPYFEEKVMHHMVTNVLEPIIKRGMYFHVNGSIPKTGATRGRKYIQRWIKNDRANTKYFIKMDIRNFFGSIDHLSLKLFIARRIRDQRFLIILYHIIGCTTVGLPLGFHTSHWLAHWYLQDLDHYIKQNLHAKYYSRYVDDIVIFGANKRRLHYVRHCITQYLLNRKNLDTKSNWQVSRFIFDRGKHLIGQFLDFMGFRFYRHKITIRRNTMLKMTRRARRISHKLFPTIHDCRRMISAVSILKQTNAYGMYLNHIKPYVDFHWIKRRISSYDKKYNKKLLIARFGPYPERKVA